MIDTKFIYKVQDQIRASVDYYNDCFENRLNQNFNTLLLCGLAVIRFNYKKDKTRIDIANKYLKILGLDKDVQIIKVEPNWTTITYDGRVGENILNNIKPLFKKCYVDSAIEAFGCCSRYLECSNEKQCVHPEKETVRGCMYKVNLDNGLIFYGKNRNV